MNMRWLVMAATVFTTLVAAPAMAEVTITHEQAGFCFDVPDKWERKVDEDNPDLLMVTSPDSGIVLQSWVLEVDDLEDAIDGLAEGLDEEFDEVKLDDETKESTVNGLDRVTLHGTAKLEGAPVLLGITLLIAEKPVIFLAMGAPEAVKEYEEILQAISDSIREPN